MNRLRHQYRPWAFAVHRKGFVRSEVSTPQELLLEVILVVAVFAALCVAVALLATGLGLSEAEVAAPLNPLLPSSPVA